MNIIEPRAPVITEYSPERGNVDVELGDDVVLSCQADALPTPDVLWTDSSVCIYP